MGQACGPCTAPDSLGSRLASRQAAHVVAVGAAEHIAGRQQGSEARCTVRGHPITIHLDPRQMLLSGA